jgi:hypothetical protein
MFVSCPDGFRTGTNAFGRAMVSGRSKNQKVGDPCHADRNLLLGRQYSVHRAGRSLINSESCASRKCLEKEPKFSSRFAIMKNALLTLNFVEHLREI